MVFFLFNVIISIIRFFLFRLCLRWYLKEWLTNQSLQKLILKNFKQFLSRNSRQRAEKDLMVCFKLILLWHDLFMFDQKNKYDAWVITIILCVRFVQEGSMLKTDIIKNFLYV